MGRSFTPLPYALTGDADAAPEVELLKVGRVPGDDLQAGVGDAGAVGEVEVLEGEAALLVSGGGEDGAHRCATCGRGRIIIIMHNSSFI